MSVTIDTNSSPAMAKEGPITRFFRATEIDATSLVNEGWIAAQDVPSALPHRVFDANDFCAKCSQPLGCAGTGKLASEVADAVPSQRLCHVTPGKYEGSNLTDGKVDVQHHPALSRRGPLLAGCTSRDKCP